MIYNDPIRCKKQSGNSYVINIELYDECTSNVQFTSNNTTFSLFSFRIHPRSGAIEGYYGDTMVYNMDAGCWFDEAYRTVTFLEPPASELLTWLQANAVKQ